MSWQLKRLSQHIRLLLVCMMFSFIFFLDACCRRYNSTTLLLQNLLGLKQKYGKHMLIGLHFNVILILFGRYTVFVPCVCLVRKKRL